ncbi:MAG: FAD-dependent monooxygenase, partial [Planctomycetota bacterium]
MFKAHYDTIIIGARCAGSATALQLARTGQRVLLVEREMDPQDTLSTHALMRPAVALLRNWGLLDQIAASTPAVCATQFIYGEERLTIPVRPAPGMAGLYAPRRWVLDKVLRDAACDAGASLRLGTRCTGLVHSDKGAVIGVQLTDQSGRTELVFADRVIGADGRSSTVAKYAEAPYPAWSDHRSAVCYAYVDGLPNEGYRWFYSASAYAGLIPTNNGQHCLFTGGTPDLFRETFTPDAFEGMMQILSIWEPGMAADLRHRGPSERVRRFAGAPGFIRQ